MKRLLTLLLAVAAWMWGFADTAAFRFRHIGMPEGLPSNCVRSIAQDTLGYMWMGTDEGLCRYDGRHMRLLTFCPDVPNKYVAVMQIAGNRLFVGSDDGLYMLDMVTEQPSQVLAQANDGLRITSTVNGLDLDKDGNLWVSTYGQGVFRYEINTGRLMRYASVHNNMSDIYVDSDNQIWAASVYSDTPLYRLDKSRDAFQGVKFGSSMPTAVATMAQDSHRNLWLGTWSEGVWRISPDMTVTRFLAPQSHDGVRHVHVIAEYEPGKMLIGSDDGLTILDALTGAHTLYDEDERDGASISNRFVYSIVKDAEGGLWLGTFYGGVDYMAASYGRFTSYAYSRFANSVQGNVISRFCEDRNGMIWIASDDGGLNCFNPANGLFTHIESPNAAKRSGYYNLHALMADGDDLWIGTYAGGVDRMNLRTRAFRTYSYDANNPRSLDGSSSYSIFKDRRGNIWVCTMTGVNRYEPATDDFMRVRTLGANTMAMAEDSNGNLWFATQGNGAYRYNPATGEWHNYTSKGAKTIAADHVNSLLIDSKGTLWAGTMQGLCRYDAEADKFVTVPFAGPSEHVCGIIEDQNALWVATVRGLAKYDPATNAVSAYTSRDGLCNDQFLPNSIFKASDGSIYVGSVKGFSRFLPYKIVANGSSAPVRITNIEVHNNTVAVGSDILPQGIDYIKKLKLPYNSNALTLEFAALSYAMPENNTFQYMLEGFDKDWIDAGNSDKASYTNLPTGNYTFRVRAFNSDGVAMEQQASLPITISPPLYLSWPFMILYVLLAAALIFFIAKRISRRIEKAHAREIKELNTAKEHEVMEEKLRFFTMVAHEIRTPVSLIIGPLEKIQKQEKQLPAQVKSELTILERNSQRLLYLVNQLLDFRKIESGGMRMHFAKQNIVAMVNAVAERFVPTLETHDVKFTMDLPESDFQAVIDSEAVTKALSNLLTNASKYTLDAIKVSCSRDLAKGTFSITVADNGIGITEEEQEKIFQPFYQVSEHKPGTGIGLSLVKSIADLHGGDITVVSAPGKGSAFTLTLPLEQVVTVEDKAVEEPEAPVGMEMEIIPPRSSQPTMLIVDDNEEMLQFLSNSFASTYNVITALDGVKALQALGEREIDMVVSDWMMPNIDGPTLVKAMRANDATSHIPVIMLTAKTDTASKITSMDVGADIFVEKPFSIQYLESCIRNLVEMRKMLREKFSSSPMVPLASIASNPTDNDFLSRLNAIIEENFANPELNVDFLASQMAISRSSLFSKIRSMTDKTPNELIQLIRLKKAAQLLKERRYRISEICYMVGFSNPSYFAKCFSRQFGVTPGDFK